MNYNNERGFALILVLIIIAVISITLPVIMTNLTNSAMQYQRSEEQLQLDKLEDMGVNFTNEVLKKVEDLALEQTKDWLSSVATTPSKDNVSQYYTNELSQALNGYNLFNGTQVNVEGGYAFETNIEDIVVEDVTTIIVEFSIQHLFKGKK
ncbi:hypothetical protein [Alkalibacillus haloalkaliphilus]|uniref:hypothetical protein n=1 Tax=Alkalibacillus haloalkaliphilus TaxID=94136 RepID=UPI0002E6FBD4|nr:hypothetical protein [Alkalibacillus haloalkaliphilus]